MRLRNEPWSLSKHVFFNTIVKQWYKKKPHKSHTSSPWKNDSCRRCNSAKVSGASYHNIDSLNIIQMTDRALKNWQQRAAWSNVIWLVAKCVIVASIRARRKRRLSVDVSLVGELMDLQYCLTDFRDLTSCFFFFFQICISLIYFESGSSGSAVEHEMSQICLTLALFPSL